MQVMEKSGPPSRFIRRMDFRLMKPIILRFWFFHSNI